VNGIVPREEMVGRFGVGFVWECVFVQKGFGSERDVLYC